MLDLVSKPVFISGVAETPLGKVSDHSEMSMIGLAAQEALAEAGLKISDVDGICSAHMKIMSVLEMAEYFGITPHYVDSTEYGGTSFLGHVYHAAMAIATGEASVVMICYASRQRSLGARMATNTMPIPSIWSQFEVPSRLPPPVGQWALATARHMHQYGTTPDQLGAVAMAARAWAQLNPKAFVREPLTLEEIRRSPMIAEPLRQLDCCLRTDGGGVVILVGPERARDAAKKPVRLIGAGEAVTHMHIHQMRDLTVTPGEISGRRAFQMAGITTKDVDVFEPYDAFTITPIMALEDLGFCERGEGGAFAAAGHLNPGGRLPSMTSGGGLSYTHPGQFGLLLMVEAVRQLRHEAGARQVANAKVAVCHGFGAFVSGNSTLVLARD